MSKRHSGRRKDASSPPEGEPWVWLTRELLTSPAWRAQSLRCRRLIDFLLNEHMAHGGNENGSLVAPYDQLPKHGITRRFIKGTIDEAEDLRLVDVQRGGRKGWVPDHLSRYRLTFLPTRQRNEFGHWVWDPPGNDWQNVTEKHVVELAAKLRKNRKQVHPYGTRPVHTGELARDHTGEPRPQKKPVIADSGRVHTGVQLSISRGHTPKSDAPEPAAQPSAAAAARRSARPRNARARSADVDAEPGTLIDSAQRIAMYDEVDRDEVFGVLTKLVGRQADRGVSQSKAIETISDLILDQMENPPPRGKLLDGLVGLLKEQRQ